MIVSILGLVALIAGVGFQLASVGNDSYATIATFLNPMGMMVVAIGLIMYGLKNK